MVSDDDLRISIEDIIESAKKFGTEAELAPNGDGGFYVLDENGKEVKLTLEELFPDIFRDR